MTSLTKTKCKLQGHCTAVQWIRQNWLGIDQKVVMAGNIDKGERSDVACMQQPASSPSVQNCGADMHKGNKHRANKLSINRKHNCLFSIQASMI